MDHLVQCSVAAMHALVEQKGANCTPAVARLCGLIHQALAELEAQLAAGLSGVKAASDVRMSMCEDPNLSPQPNSPNFQGVQGHRNRVVQFLDRWNSECERSPAGASQESKVPPLFCTYCFFFHVIQSLRQLLLPDGILDAPQIHLF